MKWILCAGFVILFICIGVGAEIDNKEASNDWMRMEKLLDENWPDHNPNYSGPGKPEKIAEAALDFLKKNPDWSKPEYDDVHTPYAARVTGKDWEVYKKAPLTHV
ncbi:hypothetical protein K8T06_11235, partial [bacterium]|nr:hypothetical protein [bacterium]